MKKPNQPNPTATRRMDERSVFARGVADAIAQRIQQTGKDYRALAAATGNVITAAMIHKYVTQGVEMRLSRLLILCMALGVKLETLIPAPAKPLLQGKRPTATDVPGFLAEYFENPAKKGKAT